MSVPENLLDRLYFLGLPPKDTIDGLAYQFLPPDGRSDESPTKTLDQVKIGDTLVGHLPGWQAILQLPQEVATTWVFNAAPNAVLTNRHQTATEVPIKYWGHAFTIVVGEMEDLASLGNKESLFGIRKFVVRGKNGKIAGKFYALYQSPLRLKSS